jgi:hypothetical protein
MNFHVKPIDNIRLLAEDTMQLVREEVLLARQELELKLHQVSNGLMYGVAAVLSAFIALNVLVAAVVIGLATTMPLWAAAASVGAFMALVALMLFAASRSRLNAHNLVPHRTIDSISRTADTVKDQLK